MVLSDVCEAEWSPEPILRHDVALHRQFIVSKKLVAKGTIKWKSKIGGEVPAMWKSSDS